MFSSVSTVQSTTNRGNKKNTINPNPTATLWSATGIYDHCMLHIFQGYMFLTAGYQSGNNGYVYRTTYPNPTTWTSILKSNNIPSNQYGIGGVDDDGTWLYYSNTNTGGIIRSDVNGNIDGSWSITQAVKGWQLIVNGNYIYISDFINSRIIQIDITNKTVVNTTWFQNPRTYTHGMCIVGTKMYISSNNSLLSTPRGKIAVVNINQTSPPTAGTYTEFTNDFDSPVVIINFINNNTLFISSAGSNTIVYNYGLAGNAKTSLTTPTGNGDTEGMCIYYDSTNSAVYLYVYSKYTGNIFKFILAFPIL